MGYAWSGQCYETPEMALSAFAKTVPNADASGINSFSAPPTINAAGLVSWSIDNRPLNSGASTIRTGITQLQQCSYDSFRVDQLPDLLVIAILVFAFFIGFRSGQSA